MGNNKHTPWFVESNGANTYIRQNITEKHLSVEETVATLYGHSEKYAQLIAAAPDLLEALTGLLKQLEGYTASTFTDATQASMVKASQAINKAKGGQS